MKLTVSVVVLSGIVQMAVAQAPDAKPDVRLVIGLDGVKKNATGKLTLQNGVAHFRSGKEDVQVPVTSIDDIFIGTEVTQSGGKAGRVVKTAAIAAPFESGKALTILMRTKVDILTVAYRDQNGALHGAIFALPKGRAEQMRTELTQAGAHTGAHPEESQQ